MGASSAAAAPFAGVPPPSSSFHRAAATDGHRGGCAIYSLRPSSCKHFPYLCTIDPRGVHVTLSHYCPTAADLLFVGEDPAEIVEGPPVFGDRMPEGLDARESLPPVADDLRLMAWDEVTQWERQTVLEVAARSGDTAVPDAAAQETFQASRWAVRLDRDSGKFVEVPPASVRCYNEGFGIE